MAELIDKLLATFGAGSASAKALAEYSLTSFVKPTAGESRRLQLSHAVLRGALREIAGCFEGEIPLVLLKGEPLEKILFGGEYSRSTGDIDLLILPGDLELARQRLAGLGYRRASDEDPRMWSHNQEAWRHQTLGVIVELHWSLAEPGVPQPSLHELFSTSEPYRFDESGSGGGDSLEVPYLQRDWLFLHLVLHFHHHMGFAKGLLDIAGWCERYGEEFRDGEKRAEFLGRMRRLGMYGMVQWPLYTIEALTGIRPALWDEGADWAVRAWAYASSSAMRDCLIRSPRSDLEATLVAIMPKVGPELAVPLLAARMLVIEGRGRKLRAFARPIWGGPHVFGRFVAGWLQ